jgi:cation diffusion facilitator family transporter
MSSGSIKAVLYALAANTGIAIMKTIAAFVTGSGSLLAESLHSWADCTNQIMLLIGMKQAKQKPDKNHPMGYEKVSYFWAMLVAVLLFFMSGLFALYEGINHILHPEPIKYLMASIGILLVAVVLEGSSLWGALKSSAKERGEQSLWGWFKTTRHSELLVVIAEDTGALAGLFTALIFLGLTEITNNTIFDAIGTVLIGMLMIFIAISVMTEVKAMITGESVGVEKEEAIRKFLSDQPEVEKVMNLITIQWGAEIMVATKAQMKMTGSEEQLIRNISVVEEKMQAKFGVKWSFFEPDIENLPVKEDIKPTTSQE